MKYECYFLHSLEDQISQKSIFLICFLFRQKKFFTRSYALARGGFARIATYLKHHYVYYTRIASRMAFFLCRLCEHTNTTSTLSSLPGQLTNCMDHNSCHDLKWNFMVWRWVIILWKCSTWSSFRAERVSNEGSENPRWLTHVFFSYWDPVKV